MARAVIFDVDGVLVDSYEPHFLSWRRLGAEHGVRLTEEQFAATFGRTSREIIRRFWRGRDLTDDGIRELDERKEALYREIVSRHFPVMEGASELLRSLHAEGFRLAVGSSGPPENVRLVLARLDPDSLIGASVTGRDVTRGKPDPQVFLLAARRLGVPPGRCVVVEDAPAGIRAAHAAGMAAVAVASTGRSPRDFDEVRPDLLVRRLAEISPESIRSLVP